MQSEKENQRTLRTKFMTMNIDEIRRLLNSFYNGDISPEDVEVLKKYFAGTDNIPDDLLLDAKIFRAMNVEKASVPTDLEQRILASTIADSAFTRRKKWNLKAIISVAASLAIIVSVALTLLIPGNKPETQVQHFAVATSVQKPYEDVSSDVPAQRALACETAQEPVIRHKADIPARSLQTEQIAEPDSLMAGTYREVTDSVEAVEITSRLIALLDASFNKGEEGLNKVEKAAAILNNPFNANKE